MSYSKDDVKDNISMDDVYVLLDSREVGIYKIENNRNHKVYIGQSRCLSRRYKDHFEHYNLSTAKIDLAISKCPSGFSWKIIEYCNVEDLDSKEIKWIKRYRSNNPLYGYNQTPGGQAWRGEKHPNAKLTEQEASKIKDILEKGKKCSEIQLQIPQATVGIISSINNGYTWFDEKRKYPISRLNGVIKYSDDLVYSIRKEYSEGANYLDLSNKYGISRDSIYRLCNTNSHPQAGLQYINLDKEPRNNIPQWVVEEARKTYYSNNSNKRIIDIYNQYLPYINNITYSSFKSMIWCETYKQYTTYDRNVVNNMNNVRRQQIHDRNQQILSLAKENIYTKQEIAEKCHCSQRTVYRVISNDVQ